MKARWMASWEDDVRRTWDAERGRWRLDPAEETLICEVDPFDVDAGRRDELCPIDMSTSSVAWPLTAFLVWLFPFVVSSTAITSSPAPPSSISSSRILRWTSGRRRTRPRMVALRLSAAAPLAPMARSSLMASANRP